MSGTQWYKGNIHTHTTESDGDQDPHKVASWYRRHGYDFLVLSDHNHLTLLGVRLRPTPLPKAVDGAGRGDQRPGYTEAKRRSTSTELVSRGSSSPSTPVTLWRRCRPT